MFPKWHIGHSFKRCLGDIWEPPWLDVVVFCSLPRFVHIQAIAQLLKSGSPVKTIDLGETCISDDGAQA